MLIKKRQNDDSVSRGKQKTEKPYSYNSNPWLVFFKSAMRLFDEDGGGEDILASVCLFIFIDIEKIQRTILPQFCN